MIESKQSMVPEDVIRAAFPKKVKDKMIRKGRRIVPLSTGHVNLPDEERAAFWNKWIKMSPNTVPLKTDGLAVSPNTVYLNTDSLADRFSEVAIVPGFFLPDTMDKHPDEQRRILSKRNKKNRGYLEVEGDVVD